MLLIVFSSLSCASAGADGEIQKLLKTKPFYVSLLFHHCEQIPSIHYRKAKETICVVRGFRGQASMAGRAEQSRDAHIMVARRQREE